MSGKICHNCFDRIRKLMTMQLSAVNRYRKTSQMKQKQKISKTKKIFKTTLATMCSRMYLNGLYTVYHNQISTIFDYKFKENFTSQVSSHFFENGS